MQEIVVTLCFWHFVHLTRRSPDNVYVEDTFLLAGYRTLCPTHAPSVIRLVRLAIFLNVIVDCISNLNMETGNGSNKSF
jgi:hypothetical protein